MNQRIAQWSPSTSIVENDYVKMEKLVGGIYHSFVKSNLDLSREACRKELNRLYLKIEEKLEKPSENYTDVQQFFQELETIKSHYQDSDLVIFKDFSFNICVK